MRRRVFAAEKSKTGEEGIRQPKRELCQDNKDQQISQNELRGSDDAIRLHGAQCSWSDYRRETPHKKEAGCEQSLIRMVSFGRKRIIDQQYIRTA